MASHGSRTVVLVLACGLLVLSAGVSASAAVVQGFAASISGTVRDESGAPVANASVTAAPPHAAPLLTTSTDADGRYRLVSLAPDTYEIAVRMPGFKSRVNRIDLGVGEDATTDFMLHVGDVSEQIQVLDAPPAINQTDYGVARSVARVQVDSLPLNGRGFLELAQLEPGVTVTSVSNPGVGANNYQRINLAGAFFHQARITVDGSTITDRFVGGTLLNVSQEAVQQFQITTFNSDPATGTGGAGAVNIVTRSGSNVPAGATFVTYRDNMLAAYPALRRDSRHPAPYFARLQRGIAGGIPIRQNSLFSFASYERNNQDGVFAISNNHPIFSTLDVVHGSPLDSEQLNVRVDSRTYGRHQMFVRATFDRNDALGPSNQLGMPSNWQSLRNRAFQIQGAVTSTLSSRIVNEFRYAFGYLGSDLEPVSSRECDDPVACIGVDQPSVLVFDAPQFRLGRQATTPFTRWQRISHLSETFTWRHRAHQFRLGGEWEHLYLHADWAFNEPAQITLWGPTNVETPALRPLYDRLPETLRVSGAAPPTFAEIMQLPLRSIAMGIGHSGLPGAYNFDGASRSDRFRLHAQDIWHAGPRLTLTGGLAYTIETNLFDHDLDYPAYLAPLLGGRLQAPRRDTNNVAPFGGVVVSLRESGRTVIRGGAGLYHDAGSLYWKARGRAFIGPAGDGRVLIDGSIVNLAFLSTPTIYTGADAIAALPALRTALTERLGAGDDLSVRGIDVIKQGEQIVDPGVDTASATHVNAGIQHELPHGFVLTADYVWRRYRHIGPLHNTYFVDRNRFNRPLVTGVDPVTSVVSFVRDPIIPLCTAAQAVALDPRDRCSTGPITIFGSDASYLYHGLHLTLDRRLRSGLQFLAGYVYARDRGFVEFLRYDDADAGSGNNPNHRRHRLTLSGILMPRVHAGASGLRTALWDGWSLSFISQILSAPALNTMLTGLDLDGDGLSRTLLPGTSYQSLGAELTVAELVALVERYNADVESRTRRIVNADGTVTVVRPRTAFNQIINPIVLPERVASGDTFITFDLRVARTIVLSRKLRLVVLADAFNLFNAANLIGYSDVLNQPNYGQPSARAGQAFGSGGPRAFQFGLRLSF